MEKYRVLPSGSVGMGTMVLVKHYGKVYYRKSPNRKSPIALWEMNAVFGCKESDVV